MRLLAFALAILPIVWAQDPEGLPSGTSTSYVSQVTPKTWASSATTKFPTLPSYTEPPASWTTLTSDGTIYKMEVTPTAGQVYTTITSGGGVWQIPVTSSSAPAATAIPIGSTTGGTHRTRTIVLSVIFSFIGAVLLLLAAMFIMRLRAQRRARNRRSWAMRPGGWVTEQKNNYPFDPEHDTARASFPEPQVPAPVPSHTRQRSL